MVHPLQTYLSRTFLELGDGFHFSAPPPDDIAEDRFLGSDEPWEVLACILTRLQQGQLEAAESLPDLMARVDDAGVWNACATLAGFAGPHRLLQRIAATFERRFGDRGVQFYVSDALANGCGLWAVPHLLAMHALASEDDTRIHLEISLSRILEAEPGPVWSGPEETTTTSEDLPPAFRETTVTLDLEGYAALVQERTAELAARLGADADKAVAEGEVVEIETVAQRLLRRIGTGEATNRLGWERMILEAATGLDCRGFFDEEGVFQPLAAAAIVEDFLESGQAVKYEPGVRYFFRHRIPD